MAPNYWNTTFLQNSYSYKHGPYDVYIKNNTSYESYSYTENLSTAEYWSNSDKYDTSYTVSLIYPSREIEQNVKKLLKRMSDALCKEGWSCHIPPYLEPKLKPVSLRNVRLDGRGWANMK